MKDILEKIENKYSWFGADTEPRRNFRFTVDIIGENGEQLINSWQVQKFAKVNEGIDIEYCPLSEEKCLKPLSQKRGQMFTVKYKFFNSEEKVTDEKDWILFLNDYEFSTDYALDDAVRVTLKFKYE